VLEVLAHQVESQLEIRKSNLKLSRMNNIKKNVMSLVAHDIRGAFSSFFGFSRILSKKIADSEFESDLKSMGLHLSSSSKQVLQVLDELLQWSESQMGSEPVKCADIDVSIALEGALALCHEAAELKEVELRVIASMPLQAHVNIGVTEAIIRNLVSNAIKFSPRKGVVELDFHQVGNNVILSVRDYGSGIPLEQQASLFKVDIGSGLSNGSQNGLGIGIGLCHALALSQKSRIWIDASITDGCKMCFSLCLSYADSTTQIGG